MERWLAETVRAAIRVLSSLGVEAEECPNGELCDWAGTGAYVSLDTKEHNYLLALIADDALQTRLTEALLGGLSPMAPPHYLRDAMGEVSNMIAGLTKSRMSVQEGPDLALGLPIFIEGRYLGTSAARTRIVEQELSIVGHRCKVMVVQQQVSGEAVRRREAEAQLRDSEERLRAILDAAPDAVITADLDGGVQSFNPAAGRMFQSDSRIMQGRALSEVLQLDCPLTDPSCQQAVGVGVRDDGAQFPVEVAVSRFLFRETPQIALVVRDTTQRQEAARALEEANQRTIELSHAAGKAEVAADVLHNVGNVLNSINTTTTLLAEQVQESKCEHLQRLVQLLDEKSDDLGAFLSEDTKGQKVLPFLRELSSTWSAQVEDTKQELAATQRHVDHIRRVIMTQQLIASAAGMTEEVSFEELVADSLTHTQPFIDGSGARVVLELEQAPRLVTDRNKVLQILINLIKNACEAIGEASGLDDPKLFLRAQAVEGNLHFELEDNGIGMSETTRERLFSHGFTTKKHGHGFGLHGCALYAKQLGGQLSVESEGEGRGATFRLTLPTESRGAHLVPKATLTPDASQGSPRPNSRPGPAPLGPPLR